MHQTNQRIQRGLVSSRRFIQISLNGHSKRFYEHIATKAAQSSSLSQKFEIGVSPAEADTHLITNKDNDSIILEAYMRPEKEMSTNQEWHAPNGFKIN